MEAVDLQEVPTQDYEFLSSPRQREVLKRRAIDLIDLSENVDSVIFLDQSARPLAYLYTRLFTKLKPNSKKPMIGFLNIGSEKTNMVDEYEIKHPSEKKSYNDIFGTENISRLKKYLSKIPGKETIVVDELEESGNTKSITIDLLSHLDNAHNYEFFTFIESFEDRMRFTYLDSDEYYREIENEGGTPDDPHDPSIHPAVAWHVIHNDMSIVKDEDRRENPGSFFTRKNPNTEERNKGLRLRAELDRLIEEIEIPNP